MGGAQNPWNGNFALVSWGVSHLCYEIGGGMHNDSEESPQHSPKEKQNCEKIMIIEITRNIILEKGHIPTNTM